MRTQATQTDTHELYSSANVRVVSSLAAPDALMSSSTSSMGSRRPLLTSSATYLATAGCCPASVVHEVDHSLFFEDKSSKGGRSRRASAKSNRSGDDLTEDDPQDYLTEEELMGAEGSDTVLVDGRDGRDPRTPSYPSYASGGHMHQHQFVIRTIPSYLTLSPRASYHRLNIKPRYPLVATETRNPSPGKDPFADLSGDTIMLCCFPNDLLYDEPEILLRNGSADDRDSVTLTMTPTSCRRHDPDGQRTLPEKPNSITALKYAEHLSWQILKDLDSTDPDRTTDYPPPPPRTQLFKSCSEYGIIDLAGADTSSRSHNVMTNYLEPPFFPDPSSSTRATYSGSSASNCSSSSSSMSALPPPPPEILELPLNDKQAQTTWTKSLEQMLEDRHLFGRPQYLPADQLPPPEFITSSGYGFSRPRSADLFDGIGSGFPPPPFHHHPSFSESELYVQFTKENFNSGSDFKNILSKDLNRRHSAIADLAIDDELDELDIQVVPPPPPTEQQLEAMALEAVIALPPPGFEDAPVLDSTVHSDRYYVHNSTTSASRVGPLSRIQHQSSSQNIMSPESELSTSQVTSVTNCSELLQTTGTTFSSDVTGSGTSGSVPFPVLPPQVPPEMFGIAEASSRKQSGGPGLSSTAPAGRFIGGRYNLDFDDDYEYDAEEDEEVDDDEFDDGCRIGPVNRIRIHSHRASAPYRPAMVGPTRVLPPVLTPQSSPYRNVDYAVAEGSSQDEEEKAKYELEFETEEEEYGIDEEELQLDAPSYKPKRPNELDISPSQPTLNTSNFYYRKTLPLPPSPPDLPMAPEPPIELPSSGRVSSKSLPENLYRSGDDEDEEKDPLSGGCRADRSNNTNYRLSSGRLARAKSNTLGRLSGIRMSAGSGGNLLQHFYPHGQFLDDPRSHGSDQRDLTPVQDIYSSDPSTAIDLSQANTVIEKQLEEEEAEEEEEKRKMLRNRQNTENEEEIEEESVEQNKPKIRDFSLEIFDRLKISPDKYHSPIYPGPPSLNSSDLDDHTPVKDSSPLAHQGHHRGRHHHHECPNLRSPRKPMLGRQDTFEDTTTTTSTTETSRREDIPLLGNDQSDSTISQRVGYHGSHLAQLSSGDEIADESDEGSCSLHFHSDEEEDVEDSEEELLGNEPVIRNHADRPPLPLRHGRQNHVDQSSSSVSTDGSLSPEGPDSTTSGSFMLDDGSPYTDSTYGAMPFFSNAMSAERHIGGVRVQNPNSNHVNTTNHRLDANGNDVQTIENNSTLKQKPANGRVVSSAPFVDNGNQKVVQQKVATANSNLVNFNQKTKPSKPVATSRYDARNQKTLVTNLDEINPEDYLRQHPTASTPQGATNTGSSCGGDSYNLKGMTSSGETQAPVQIMAHISTPESAGTIGTQQFRVINQQLPPSMGMGSNVSGQLAPVMVHQQFVQPVAVMALQIHHPPPLVHQFCPADAYEPCSQATERDLERSEFSLLHQNSELDEDESLTFDNPNNQSLSVIDEDGAPLDTDRSVSDKPISVPAKAAVYLDRFDSKELESERDLSLEAVLQEESKALERQVREAQQAKAAAAAKLKKSGKSEQIGQEDELPAYIETSIVFSDAEDLPSDPPQRHDSTTSHPTLKEEEAGSQLYSGDDKTTLQNTSQGIIGSHLDDDRTELRDERISLLGDTSDYTHSGLPHSPTGNHGRIGSPGKGFLAAVLPVPTAPLGPSSNKKQFNKKLAEMEQRLMKASIGHPEAIPESESSPPVEMGDGSPERDQVSGGNAPEETTANTLTYSSCSHNGTSHSGTVTGSNTISECSSSVMTPDLSGPTSSGAGIHPVPILKRSGKDGHRHHRHSGAGVVFAPHHHHKHGSPSAGPSSSSSVPQGHHHHGHYQSRSSLPSTSSQGEHCCTKCYHRHHGIVGQPPPQYSHQTLPARHYHRHGLHYHHHHRGQQSESHLQRPDGIIVEQARARSLTRTLGSGTSPVTPAPCAIHGVMGNTGHHHHRRSRDFMGDNTSEDASDPSRDQTPTNETVPITSPDQRRSPCSQHLFTCSYCGESTMPPNMTPVLTAGSGGRMKKRGMLPLTRKSFTVEDVYFDVDDEENDIGVHTESYRSSQWIYIGRKEELSVWGTRNRTPSTIRKNLAINQMSSSTGGDSGDTASISTNRSESEESTVSEKCFRKNYESITHRLIHRKASIELYRRILDRTFAIDKCLTLTRDNNEFGFRIHGSRPVVVSAIEKGTSAEHKGLEVGDIIVSVNSVSVLDASHSEVVKLAAHKSSSKLTLEVTSTAASFRNESATVSSSGQSKTEIASPAIIINGYLKRFLEKAADQIGNSTDKMTNTKLWRRRWFVLKSDACLYWYRNPKSIEPIGAISLQGYCTGIVNECLYGQEHLFRLIGYGNTPVKYFAATDHDTANQWVKALNQNSVRFSNSDTFIENTLHNIHRNPLSFPLPDCYGFLSKFNQLKKTWKQRYFVLKDACLYFYADANSNTALGLFYLHGYKVLGITMTGKKHAFEITPPSSKFRQLWLCADSDADKKRWLAALEYSIDRWIQLS